MREIVIEQKYSEKKLQIVDVVHVVSVEDDLKKVSPKMDPVEDDFKKVSSKMVSVADDLKKG